MEDILSFSMQSTEVRKKSESPLSLLFILFTSVCRESGNEIRKLSSPRVRVRASTKVELL